MEMRYGFENNDDFLSQILLENKKDTISPIKINKKNKNPKQQIPLESPQIAKVPHGAKINPTSIPNSWPKILGINIGFCGLLTMNSKIKKQILAKSLTKSVPGLFKCHDNSLILRSPYSCTYSNLKFTDVVNFLKCY